MSTETPTSPTRLSPLCVGCWDGVALWVQWDRADEGQAFGVRVRLRKTEKDEWGKWLRMGKVVKGCFFVVPTMREGWQIQAQVAALPPLDGGAAGQVGEPAEDAWETAMERIFQRSRCEFRVRLSETAKAPVQLLPRAVVSARVDRAGCSYSVPAGTVIALAPGGIWEGTLEALHLSGWCQLDHPGHFAVWQTPWLWVENTAPSVNDLRATGAPRDFTVLAKQESPGGPGVLVKTGENFLVPPTA